MKKVVLLAKVHGLGSLGDEVKVKPGYARNYLLPEGKAVSATAANLAVFQERRAELEKKEAEFLKVAQKRAEKIIALATLSIPAKAADEGKLYGSIGVYDIAHALTAAGVEISKSEVRLPTGPIRQTGEYHVELFLHSDVVTPIKIVIIPE